MIAMDDIQLHQKALAYQRIHCVSYSEAVSAVASFSEADASGGSAPSNAGHVRNSGTRSDADVDRAAKTYAREHCVSYSEALSVVCSFNAPDTSTGSAPPHAGHVGDAGTRNDTDRDKAAKAYAREHGVSYSEAISAVCSFSGDYASLNQGFVSFGEAGASSPAVAAIEGAWIEIFKAGNHISDSGESYDFTPNDISGMASSYNPDLREAPLTLGHPKNDLPAYGWVNKLQAPGDGRLLMKASNVDPQFAQMVQERRYKKRSASFYPPKHPSNPTPGKWYLRHVAWLGAQQPAIAGMKDIQSAGSTAGSGHNGLTPL